MTSRNKGREQAVTSRNRGREQDVTSRNRSREQDVTSRSRGREKDVTSRRRGREQDVTSRSRGREQDITSRSRGREQDVTSRNRGREQAVTSRSRGREQAVTSRSRGREQDVTIPVHLTSFLAKYQTLMSQVDTDRLHMCVCVCVCIYTQQNFHTHCRPCKVITLGSCDSLSVFIALSEGVSMHRHTHLICVQVWQSVNGPSELLQMEQYKSCSNQSINDNHIYTLCIQYI